MSTAIPPVGPNTSPRLSDLFQVFVHERRVLKNVSRKTQLWYDSSYRAFEKYLEPLTVNDDIKGAVNRGIEHLRSRLNPISINDYLRCLNAFFAWLAAEGYRQDRVKIPKLTEPEPLPKLLPDCDISKLLQFKPTGKTERAVHAMALIILDVGPRIEEVLNLRKDQVDFDSDTLFISMGKGGKQRQLPLSAPLKSTLVRFINHCSLVQEGYRANPHIFVTRSGKVYSYRNLLRGLHRLAAKLGVPVLKWHQLRHTFATSYLRGGGNVVHLRRLMGHRSLLTTQRYEHLVTADLARAHRDHSLLVLRAGKR